MRATLVTRNGSDCVICVDVVYGNVVKRKFVPLVTLLDLQMLDDPERWPINNYLLVPMGATVTHNVPELSPQSWYLAIAVRIS